MAAGLQPSKRALPTLLPEGLGKEVHLRLALQTQHPFTLRNPLSEYCEFAVNGQQGLSEPLGALRHRVTGLILDFSAALKFEAESIVSRCHPWLISVLGPRNVPLMRELT